MLGDRRDYFESLSDVWDLFRVIIEQRKQRELNPTLSMLRVVAIEVVDEKETDPICSLLKPPATGMKRFRRYRRPRYRK